MKIVFVVFSLRGGGAERVVSELSNDLIKDFDVAVIQLSDIEPFYKLTGSVQHFRFDGPQHGPLRYARLAHYLFKALQEASPDVVVSFGETINPFVIFVSRMAGFPVVVSNRASPLSSLRGRRGWLNPFAYRFANAVLVQTERAVDLLKRRYRGSRWMVMSNPVKVPEVVPPDCERENLCVSVGFLGGQKNQATIIRSFSESAPSDWTLLIVGDGPDRKYLEKLSSELELGTRIEFTGAVFDVYKILARSRVFAFASRTEGVPNALAEAMANGCACIAFDCITGPRELIEDGQSGLLIELDDESAFTEGLSRLMADSALRERLSSGARIKAATLVLSEVRNEFVSTIHRALDPDSI